MAKNEKGAASATDTKKPEAVNETDVKDVGVKDVKDNAKKPAAVDEEETVVVSKKDLQALIKKVDDQAEDIKVLYKTADKSRLQRYDEKEREAALVKTARAWFYNDKLVVATKLISNQSDIVNGRPFQDQQLEVFFEDGTNEKMQYRDFEVHKKYVKAEVVGTRSEDDETFFKMLFSDGRKVDISVRYIN